jgi:hypothetical protein
LVHPWLIDSDHELPDRAKRWKPRDPDLPVQFPPDESDEAGAPETIRWSQIPLLPKADVQPLSGGPYSVDARTLRLPRLSRPTARVADLGTVRRPALPTSVLAVASRGRLTLLIGSPYATGSSPLSVAFSRTGLLATVNNTNSTVSVFSTARPSPSARARVPRRTTTGGWA